MHGPCRSAITFSLHASGAERRRQRGAFVGCHGVREQRERIALRSADSRVAIHESGNRCNRARVQGFAIGGGNVLCTICDLTICSDKAIFGQVGPKMGSVDPGYGTAFLARVVGEKKAREIWYLNKRYSGQEAVDMGLANICVPHEQLDATVQEWAETICERSPTAIAIAKRSFNMDTAHQAGIAGMGMYALKLYYDTEESREGVKALQEKRKPDFRKYAK